MMFANSRGTLSIYGAASRRLEGSRAVGCVNVAKLHIDAVAGCSQSCPTLILIVGVFRYCCKLTVFEHLEQS